jgi:long-subunit acyl-CoA synthetase (AMP-forming)
MVASVFAAIATTARQRPEAIALGQGARTITYGALQGFLAACRPHLQGPQQVIGIATSDPLEAALADLALTACGHISVHLPPFFSTTQKAHIIQAAGLTAVIGQDQPDLPRLPYPRHLPRMMIWKIFSQSRVRSGSFSPQALQGRLKVWLSAKHKCKP